MQEKKYRAGGDLEKTGHCMTTPPEEVCLHRRFPVPAGEIRFPRREIIRQIDEANRVENGILLEHPPPENPSFNFSLFAIILKRISRIDESFREFPLHAGPSDRRRKGFQSFRMI